MSYNLTTPINNTVGFKKSMTLYQDILNAKLAGKPLSLEIINKEQAEIIEVLHKEQYDKNIKCIELEDEIDEKDKNIIELEDDCDKLEKARVKQSLKTIALKKIVEEKDKIFKESQSDLLFSKNLWISSCKEVKEKDKTIEIMTKKIEDLEKEVIAYKYNKDPSYDPSSSEEEEDEEDEELSYEDDPDWNECEDCIVGEGEMILNMSEGHNAWGYVITKSGVFLRSPSGHYPINGKLVWTGIGKGSYVCDKINEYSLKEGEMDVYNFFITDHKAIMDL